MEDNSAQVPLLVNQVHKKGSVLVSSVKWVLQVLMMVVFASWVVFIFVYPTDFGNGLFGKWTSATDGTLFGITGSIFLLVSGPVLVIALLGALHLVISGNEDVSRQKSTKFPRVRLWTFPVLVDGPFGVISAAELIGILLFVAYIVSAMYSYTLQNLALISELHLSGETSIWMLELTGLRLGMMGLFCLAFLFLPVARGSVLLRLIDIPFEHAARYHVWLGHLTMLLFTLHGLFYVIGWALQGKLLKEILEWRNIGIANLAGVISLLAGLLMWVTSMPGLRTWNFELFFYTHQLYVIFILFLAFHVGDFIFSIAAGPIYLFMMDRFLRFCQSRKKVGIVSAKTLPCGTVELVLSKPASLRYNALSFVFLQLRELSWLQWHPFSVSSSPLDGKYHLSVLIKVLGGWTDTLTKKLNTTSETSPGITVSVEGPYGHEVPYHLMYEHLILVAGGIGISPFLAILSDILHRLNEGRPCLPRNVMVIWAIKKSDELPLLSNIDMEKICPHFSAKLKLEIQIFVTRETESSVEEGRVNEVSSSPIYPTTTKGHGMSVLVGTGHNVWSGLYVLSSTLGLVILLYLVDTFYINPFGISSWWYKGLLFIGCMVASVVVFGGVVIGFWHLWENKSLARDEYEDERNEIDEVDTNEDMINTDLHQKTSYSSTMIHYGSRPDFTDILSSVTKRWGHVDIGVIVCGPPTLQASVARSIRSQNLRRDSTSDPVFHFNSHSFDL